MGKRIKKPPVRPEVRREWLRRYEIEGESPPQIATEDGYDARTVRKQIQEAQREREIREGRLTVLRSAIEGHQGDLANFAKQLDSLITGEAAIPAELRSEPMWLALRQHLPRSPLWRGFDKWNNLLDKIVKLRSDTKTKLEKDLKGDAVLRRISASGGSGVIPGMVEALDFQMGKWARGAQGLNIQDDFRIKPDKDNLVSIEYGAFHLGKVKKQQAIKIKGILVSWEAKVKTWGEYYNTEKMLQELKRAKEKLKDELTTIILRRVVPGQCKYCPA